MIDSRTIFVVDTVEILTEIPEVVSQPIHSTFLYHSCNTQNRSQSQTSKPQTPIPHKITHHSYSTNNRNQSRVYLNIFIHVGNNLFKLKGRTHQRTHQAVSKAGLGCTTAACFPKDSRWSISGRTGNQVHKPHTTDTLGCNRFHGSGGTVQSRI